MAIIHGGQLSKVAKQFAIPEQAWLDLSTGIAPFSYAIPAIPEKIWQDLPTISPNLITAAQQYYQAEFCWPVAGSQQLIEKLPSLWNDKNSAIKAGEAKHAYLPKVGYKEHQRAWSLAGYQLHFYQEFLPNNIEKNSVVIVINPNNPLTDTFSIQQLTQLKKHCQQQQALLIIDEAFADIFTPEFSFVPHITNDNGYDELIVLRSFGKFFGLAGIRIGFVCTTEIWRDIIKESIGPWSINGPALFIAEQALKDTQWQVAQNERLNQQSEAMQLLLKSYLLNARIEANALFITVFLDNAPDIYEKLCRQAVYVRLTDEGNALRFGLTDMLNMQRLDETLATIT
ncbi:threonine-phosphate decarboxylase [Psychromonas sp. GE-S-Ul-11]|uniref:threonine-phosphate decarboxylase n=1 Tax=Psychromonas sp. GE-S-Ul-11 TaxID=3241170 RepID=UPI00390C6F11